MIKPILEKKWPASDGTHHPTLTAAQEREITMLLSKGVPVGESSEVITPKIAAQRVMETAEKVVAILTNKKPRKDKGTKRKKPAAKAPTISKEAQDAIDRAKTKPTGITFGKGGVTKEGGAE